ncbi:MAG: hypothetical protein M3144_12850 [Actinomycetota bacterium]|nr:hypothetical protein [Actinomycetota bacterium]
MTNEKQMGAGGFAARFSVCHSPSPAGFHRYAAAVPAWHTELAGIDTGRLKGLEGGATG